MTGNNIKYINIDKKKNIFLTKYNQDINLFFKNLQLTTIGKRYYFINTYFGIINRIYLNLEILSSDYSPLNYSYYYVIEYIDILFPNVLSRHSFLRDNFFDYINNEQFSIL